MSIRFNEEDARPMGRPAGGVRGISLTRATTSSRWPSSCRTRNCWSPAKMASANARILRNTASAVTRRQGHHHDENQREDRRGCRRAHRSRYGRDHADHRRRPDGAHSRARHPRGRAQHARRQTGEPRRTGTNFRPSRRSSARTRKTPRSRTNRQNDLI